MGGVIRIHRIPWVEGTINKSYNGEWVDNTGRGRAIHGYVRRNNGKARGIKNKVRKEGRGRSEGNGSHQQRQRVIQG